MSDAEKVFLLYRGLPIHDHDGRSSPEFLLWVAALNERILERGSPPAGEIARILSQQEGIRQ